MATAAPSFATMSRRTCLGAMLGSCAAPGVLALAPPVQPPDVWMPRLRLNDGGAEPVRVESVSLCTEVVGQAVHSRVELVFRNPNARVLEGELQFPLREGQWVSGFELDINGELRPAVVVDKARGQQVFEDVIRARVDPALLEVTQGHNYKLRIYPLPPQGTRRVVLHLAQTLDRQGRLELPLRFAESLARLDLQVLVAGVPAEQVGVVAPGLPLDGLSRRQLDGEWAQLEMAVDAAAGLPPSLQITVPPRRAPVVATQWHDNRQHFYAELPLASALLATAPRAKPRRIALLWDASGSAARRDREREFALLDAYFHALGQVEVVLHVGRDTVEPARRFQVRRGAWSGLRQALAGMACDGASNLPALVARASSDADLALLFSDGLSNWGAGSAPATGTLPLYAIGQATGAHTVRLRQVAERSGGEWLDLATLSTAAAARALQTCRSRLRRMSSLQARELVAASPYPEAGRLRFAGVLAQARAEVVLEFEQPDGSLVQQRLAVVPSGRMSSQAAQHWAGLRMAELEAGWDDARSQVRQLGRAYGLVSRETSLIVLEALNDYVRFEIQPPESLRAAYQQALAQQTQRARLSRGQHLDRVAARFGEQVAWWEKDFPKQGRPAQKAKQDQQQDLRAAAQGAIGRQQFESAKSGPPMPLMAPPAPAERREARSADEAAPAALARRAASKAASAENDAMAPATAAIRLQPWTPDVPYARRLREAPRESVYQRYLDERAAYQNSTAFFLDAADVLFSRELPELAMRVLSNLAEMDLENRHILRVLGYRLLQARAPRLAVPVLREVQRLSPNEPQSFRDLGLAHAEAAQWQEAADQLWQVVSRPWDGRFPDIDLTALAEMNMVIARAQRSGHPVATGDYDRRLLRNLPLDLRITLAWDADNTDIDLWVTDPDGEQVYYGHRLSYQGARISRDVTGGYGPEEFALKVAKPGRYLVQARFYGHRQQLVSPATTLMLRLSTGFGRADQKDELVTLRLSGPADMVTVGTFEVTASGQAAVPER